MKRTDTCESIAPGQYVVTRKVELAGRLRSHRIVCSNPAYGFRRLDEWEQQERLLHQARRRIVVALEQAGVAGFRKR